jgi:O-antigen ligase
MLDQSFGERLYAFKKAGYFITHNPIFGGGIGALGGVLDNHYARIIIETGLVGLGLFFWLILRLLSIGFRLFRYPDGKWIKGAGISFIAIVLGLLIHCFGNITFYIVRIAEPFWAIAGLAAYLLYYIKTQETNVGKDIKLPH